MIFSGILSLLAILSGTLALGSPVDARSNEVKIVFLGAANARFTERFPLNGAKVKISML